MPMEHQFLHLMSATGLAVNM